MSWVRFPGRDRPEPRKLVPAGLWSPPVRFRATTHPPRQVQRCHWWRVGAAAMEIRRKHIVPGCYCPEANDDELRSLVHRPYVGSGDPCYQAGSRFVQNSFPSSGKSSSSFWPSERRLTRAANSAKGIPSTAKAASKSFPSSKALAYFRSARLSYEVTCAAAFRFPRQPSRPATVKVSGGVRQ